MTRPGGPREPSSPGRLLGTGLALVVAVEVAAITLADHRYVLWASGITVAVVLLAGRRLMESRTKPAPAEVIDDDRVESMRRWITRTETLLRWADSTRSDWDRHLRPRLAREFLMATGQRQTTSAVAIQASGRMVFGDELWQWVDPGNVANTGGREPGPGRDALDEILRRLERV